MKGSVTAGNASPLSDGAAAALVMSRKKAESLGLQGLGVLRAFVTAGVDPAIMGIGPIPAVRKLFDKTGLSMKDIDLVELNEAFGSQAVYVQRTLEIPRRQAERQRRRHRSGTPPGVHRGQADRDGAVRAEETRRSLRHRHHVHRRRPGCGRPVRTAVAPRRSRSGPD